MTGPVYRVEFADLPTDRTIARFAVEDLRFGRRISDSETITGTVPVTSSPVAELLHTCVAKRTAVYVYDGAMLQVGGVLWDTVPTWTKRGGEGWQFNAATWESYLHQVVISDDIAPATSVDQLEIARTLVTHMQADPAANLGITLDPALSGVLRDRTQYLASANKSYGEALTELGNVQGGFEWTIDVWVDPTTGQRVKYLRFGYPTVGRADAVQTIELQDLDSWSEPSGGALAGTRFRARGGTAQGAGTVDQQPLLSTVHTADDLIAAGWPRLDVVNDYSTVTDIDTLEDHAERDLIAGTSATVIPQVAVNLTRVRLSPVDIGNTVRLRMRTIYRGLTDTRYRMVGIVVSGGQRGTHATAQLTLEAVS